jgi:ERCC4-type nuclease
MCSCKIDIREHSLHESLKSLGVDFIPTTLDVGDIDIQGTKGQRFLFERKTIEDLASSLRDGRFKDQKDRLLGVLQREPMTAIAYIIEGKLGFNLKKVIHGHVTVGSLISLLNTLQLKYRIPVVFTGGVSETSIYIQCIMNRLTTEPDFSPVCDGSNAGCFEHTSLLPKIASNRKTDRDSILISMLTAIPGVSHKISSTIVEWFNVNHEGIMKYVRNHVYQEFDRELFTIKVSSRSISKKIREMIINVFYGDEIEYRESSRSSSPDVSLVKKAPPLKKRNPTNKRITNDLSIPLFVDDISPVDILDNTLDKE